VSSLRGIGVGFDVESDAIPRCDGPSRAQTMARQRLFPLRSSERLPREQEYLHLATAVRACSASHVSTTEGQEGWSAQAVQGGWILAPWTAVQLASSAGLSEPSASGWA
jgi:hypothetical protein